MNNQNTDNNWASLSDIMTGLMVIFMFIAIAYMVEAEEKQEERDKMFEEFMVTKETLYSELDSVFRDDFKKWDVELDKDLSIKFTNPQILFTSGEARIRSRFKEILDSFFPRYLAVIMQPKYQNKIAEVRIEGHTDPTPISSRKSRKKETFIRVKDSLGNISLILQEGDEPLNEATYRQQNDAYIQNIELSQDRARNVLSYVRTIDTYSKLPETEQQLLQFWLTANGLSYGRTLDDNKQLVHETGNEVNNRNSRRVEFRIITSSDKLVEEVIKQMN
jgi:outer membrane protein OmpA-like peptidoglycan-associated protein